MRVDVLGPVAISDGGQDLSVGGPRQQAVLAVLGLLAGTPVPIGGLIDAVWAGDPPRTAEHTLHNYVLRLRRTGLEIIRVGDGYRLDTATDAQALEAADPRNLADTLRLVRGTPGQGLADSDLIRSRCAALTETIEALREDAAAAAIASAADAADAGRQVAELRSMVTAQPYRERRWELLMLALYRAGRQSEALDAFAEARSLLDRDLGIEPSPSLRTMQQAVLSQDPAIAGGRSTDDYEAAVVGGGRSLPGFATRLVGRVEELAALRSALGASRLVSVVGPIGAGKTRLAMEVSREFSVDVWFVSIEDLPAPTSVAEAVLAVVAPSSRAGDAELGLAAALATSDGLLVIDAAEHRVDEVGRFVDRLLTSCPSLRFLVTTRQSLRLRDEASVPVAALSGEDRRALLVDRARLADPTFTLVSADLATVDRLCELVDGLPLGIELVARHLRLLSVAELVDRVDADLDRWTTRGGEAGLIGAVASSVDQLAPNERTLLTCLAVLAAEADLELIQQVVAAEADDDWVFGSLATLVDRSLVQVRGGPAGVRYAVLLSVRRFCLPLLDEAERQRLEQRYVAAVLRRFARLAVTLTSVDRSAVLTQLDADAPHLRTALAASLEGDAATALQVAADLSDYWLARRPAEGMAWLQRLLALSPTTGTARAEVLLQMGHLAYWLTEFELGTKLLVEARELLAETDNSLLLGRVLRRLGAIAAATDEVADARGLLAQSASVLADGSHDTEAAISLLHLGSLLADEGRTTEALPVLAKARDQLRLAGDPLREGHALAALSLAWWKAGDLIAAKGAGERAIEQFRGLGHRPTEGVVAYRLAAIARSLGDRESAIHYVGVALAAGRQSGTRTTTALAQLAAARLDLDVEDSAAAAANLTRALEAIDTVADRWVLAEALEVAGRLQAGRGLPAGPLLERAGELRAEIGQPAPPSDAAEIAVLIADLPRGSDRAGVAPDISDPTALRAWVLGVCAGGGPGEGTRSPVPAG